MASSADLMMEVGPHAGLYSGDGVEEWDLQSGTMPAFSVMVEEHISKFNMLFIRNCLLEFIIHLAEIQQNGTPCIFSLTCLNLLHSKYAVDDKQNIHSRW